MTNAQAAPASSAAPVLTLLAAAAEAAAQADLARFEAAIQAFLDNPLDAGRVAEWTALRASRPLAV